ncbi:Kelch domain-containing protein 10 [Thelohanellus kitauei]|uniref:Kelch domain-containing protein 10 n=1 Tax=Thelohanellus kitauei TaxID=669202 RepID=A0A0C2NGY2_THEKT|nr:Kelch domain-containing protein 10 [Thelohanellus kitauei]
MVFLQEPKEMKPKSDPEELPLTRTAHCMLGVDNYVVIYGGKGPDNSVLDEIWAYDTLRRVWSHSELPIEVQKMCLYSSMCACRTFVYIFGGTNYPLGDQVTNLLLQVDIRHFRWRILFEHSIETSDDIPQPMFQSTIFYKDRGIFVVQPVSDTEKFASIYRFCLDTSSWKIITNFRHEPEVRFLGYGTIFNEKLFYFSRSDISINKFFEVGVYKMSMKMWGTSPTTSPTGEYPVDRENETWAFGGKYGYLCGGQRLDMESKRSFIEDVWRIDLETFEWKKLNLTPKQGRSHHAMALLNEDCLYVFGGITSDDIPVKDGIKYVMNPPSKICRRECFD